jgi:predicted ATPase
MVYLKLQELSLLSPASRDTPSPGAGALSVCLSHGRIKKAEEIRGTGAGYMLNTMRIKNFKAIQDMTIEFTPLTVLIGANSCGKSTVLQALDFLRSVASRDIHEYLKDQKWTFEELKSQLGDGKNNAIEFITAFDFMINNKKETVEWTFIVDNNNGRWQIKEKFVQPGSNTKIISAHDISEFILEASWLKYFSTGNQYPILAALKRFLDESMFFGVLSPADIRSSDTQKIVDNVGLGGKTLAAFIHNMTEDHRKKLDELVSDFVEFTVNIKTIDLGGRIEMYLEENFNGLTTRINNDHISDGLLRIIAFISIALQKGIYFYGTPRATPVLMDGVESYISVIDEHHNGMIILDEIENGINPYLAEKVTELLKDITKKTERQVIITTHSPIILDNIDPESLNFLWKDETGAIQCQKMFDSIRMKNTLKALNPGEVWVNLNREQILERMGSK